MKRLVFLLSLSGCGSYASEREFCISETNRYRASVGKPALARDASLENFADAGAAEDDAKKSAHYHFIQNENGTAYAENEIPGWLGWTLSQNKDVHGVMQAGLALMWAEGPGGGHYDNMTGDYTKIGCGIAVNGDQVTVVQDFK